MKTIPAWLRCLAWSLIGLAACLPYDREASAMTSGRRPAAAASAMPEAWNFAFERQLYVSNAGSDANSGTIEMPLETIREALRRARSYGSGTEILVRAGEYDEGDILVDFDGTPTSWNALRGYPNERPRIVGRNNWQLVHLRGSYFLLEGFQITGSKGGTTTSDGTRIGSRMDTIAWGKRQTTCWSGEVCGSGVYVEAWPGTSIHHVVVRDNLVHDFPGGGIAASGGDYLLIERNFTHHNAFTSFYGHSGISVWHSRSSGPGPQDEVRILVRGNVSYANHQHVPSTAIGINRPTDGNGIIFDQNRALAYPYRMRAENNIVFDNGGSGIHVYDTDNVDLVNNTAYGNSRGITQDDGEIFANTTRGVRIYNNILVAVGGKRVNSNWGNENLQTGANILFGAGSPDLVGQGDLVGDPELVEFSRSFSQLDVEPRPGSPAVDAASPVLAATTDFFMSRPNGPRDIGAVELR